MKNKYFRLEEALIWPKSLEGLMLKLKLQYLATSCEKLTHRKRPWCREGLGTGGEGDDRGWDGWMVSPTQWTWVWANSGSWWWTGSPGVLRFMGSQRVRHDWATELNWTDTRFENLFVFDLGQMETFYGSPFLRREFYASLFPILSFKKKRKKRLVLSFGMEHSWF